MTYIDPTSIMIGFCIGLLTAFLCMIVYKWAGNLVEPKEVEPKEMKRPLRHLHYITPPPSVTERITNAINQVSAQSSYLRHLAGNEFNTSSFFKDICLSLAIIIDNAVKDMTYALREKYEEDDNDQQQ